MPKTIYETMPETMPEKKLLAILGSPHPHGITAGMLQCALAAAREHGWRVEQINLYEKQLAFCTGCRACMGAERCVLKDDIQEITDQIKACDMVVLAAPVYWANVPAIVKNLFDRLLGAAMEETKTFPVPRLAGKQYILLTACNTPFPFSALFGQSGGTIRAVREFFKTAGVKCAGNFVCAGAEGKTEVPERLKKKIWHCFESGRKV